MLRTSRLSFIGVAAITMSLLAPSLASARHSWGPYHWAREVNPLTLKLDNNVSGVWDGHLGTASGDWSKSRVGNTEPSTVLNTTFVTGGTSASVCPETSGRVEVCNWAYGNTRWLGMAQIWISGSHITQGMVKVNDTYFNTAFYNTPEWRNLVMCQEVGHTLGLSHVDTAFYNKNRGTCMDYTSNPSGPPSNEHPNQHDYDQLATIYSHIDSTTTGLQTAPGKNAAAPADGQWGQLVALTDGGRTAVYVLDAGGDQKVFTFVIWK